MQFPFIPFFRRIRSVGIIREWYAVEADRAIWNDVRYPPPPQMGRPDQRLFSGAWDDVRPSYTRFDRYRRTRGVIIESKKKVRRLRKRREARKYRASQKKP